MRQMLLDELEQLLAVEVLNYHNKNWLTSPKLVNEMTQDSLKKCIDITKRFELDDAFVMNEDSGIRK